MCVMRRLVAPWCVGGGVMSAGAHRARAVSPSRLLGSGAVLCRVGWQTAQGRHIRGTRGRRMLPIALVLHQGLVGCLFVQFRGTCQPDDGTQTQAGGWRAPTCSSQAGRHRRAGGDLAHLRSRPDPQHSTGMYDNTKAGTARHHRHRVDARHHGRSRAIWRLSRVGRAKNDFCCAYPNANF